MKARGPAADLLVLSAPAIRAAVPAWQRLAVPVLGRLSPTLVLANPIDVRQLAHDPAVGQAYDADPLVRQGSTTRPVPTAVSEPLEGLPDVERRVYPGLRHETMNEPEGAPQVVADIVAWLREWLAGRA